MGKNFISCEKATTICDKSQYGEASFREILKLKIHFIFCKICKCYSSQNSLLTKLFGNYCKGLCKKEKGLCSEDKEIMKTYLKEKMEE
jgi:hypothetical protein